MRLFFSLSLKLTVPLLLLLFAAILSTVNYLYYIPQAEHAVEEKARQRLFQELSRLQGSFEYLLRKQDVEGVRREVAALASNPEYVVIAIVDEARMVLAATRRAWFGHEITKVFPVFENTKHAQAVSQRRPIVTMTHTGHSLFGYTSILIGSRGTELRPSRIGCLFFAYDLHRPKTEARAQILDQSLYWTGLISALALALWGIFHVMLTQRAERLVRAAERLAEGDLTIRSRLQGQDELAQLSQAFDGMAAQIADTQMQLQQILNNTTAMVYVKDTEGRYLLVNPQYERLFRRRQAELIGKTDAECFPEEMTGQFYYNDIKVLNQEKPLECEETALLDDGLHTYVSTKFPLYKATGDIYAVCSISTDITARKRVEKFLRDSEQRLQRQQAALRSLTRERIGQFSALDLAFKNITQVAADTLETERVGIWLYDKENKSIRCHDLYQRQSQQHDAGTVLVEADYPAYFAALTTERNIAAVDATHDPRTQEFGIGYLELYGITSMLDAPIRRGGDLLGVICHEHVGPLRQWTLDEQNFASSIADLTALAIEIWEHLQAEEALRASVEERIAIETQLRQAQKMEALGHLTGGIAHDFNNILTSMMGYAVLAQERQTVIDDAKLGRYLEQIYNSGRRAQEVIQQMLTFSRGQRGAPQPLSLPTLIKESLRLLGATMPSTIEFHTEFAAQSGTVMFDPVQFEQVLMNLCINARDAMAGNGFIKIAVRQPEPTDVICSACRQNVSGTYVEMRVADSGQGIAVEIVDRIFEPFFTTKEVGKGSGMGLAMVHGIVHDHKGHIVVSSDERQGTAFSVLLPVVEQLPAKSQESGGFKALSGVSNMTGRVLVVDDERTVAEFMSDLLTERGFVVEVVTASMAAYELLRERSEEFDLVITDQTMPKMTGLELAHEIAKIRADLPVLLYTGHGNALTEDAAKAAGVKGVLKKPVEIEVLFGMILEVLRR